MTAMTEYITIHSAFYFHQYELITWSSHTSVTVHRLSKTPVSQRSNIILGEFNLRSHNFIIFANTTMCRVPIPVTQVKTRGLSVELRALSGLEIQITISPFD